MSKILLSTDIGSDVDDSLALLSIMNKGIDLDGIYTVNGDVAYRAYIARHLTNLTGRNDIEVGIGEGKSLSKGAKPFSLGLEEYKVDDSFVDWEASIGKDIVYKKPESQNIKKNGLEALSQKLSEEKHTIFSIGPLTNIAKILKKSPQLARNIERIYQMGCNFDSDNAGHNVYRDVTSAQMVFNSGIPMTVIPKEVCDKGRLPLNSIDNLKGTEAGKYVRRMILSYTGGLAAREVEHYELIRWIEEGKTKTIELFNEKEKLLKELDESNFAASEPEKYWSYYHRLIEILKNGEWHKDGYRIARILEMVKPKDVSVSDVYVPFCYLNSDLTETEKVSIEIDDQGKSHKTSGENHTIVRDLDYGKFKEFSKESLI